MSTISVQDIQRDLTVVTVDEAVRAYPVPLLPTA
jgi:PIN domain nuclease of toxin-antitoxin system